MPTPAVTTLDSLTYAGNLANLEPRARRPAPSLRARATSPIPRPSRALERGCRRDRAFRRRDATSIARSAMPTPFLRTNVVGPGAARRRASRGVAALRARLHRRGLRQPRTRRPRHRGFPLRPTSPYAASKAASDLLALAYARTHGLDVVVTRCSNNFGPFQFPEKLIPLFITNALADEPLPLYGDGGNVRDWIHVEDHCAALDARAR